MGFRPNRYEFRSSIGVAFNILGGVAEHYVLACKNFFNWIANNILPWEEYHAFMSVHLITIDKHPDV